MTNHDARWHATICSAPTLLQWPLGFQSCTPLVKMQEEEAGEAAAKGSKQAGKKARMSKKSAKRAAKAAAPSPADCADATPEAAAAGQPVDRHAASGSRTQPSAQPTAGPDVTASAAVQPPASSEADSSWQLCALTKVGEVYLGDLGDEQFMDSWTLLWTQQLCLLLRYCSQCLYMCCRSE